MIQNNAHAMDRWRGDGEEGYEEHSRRDTSYGDGFSSRLSRRFSQHYIHFLTAARVSRTDEATSRRKP